MTKALRGTRLLELVKKDLEEAPRVLRPADIGHLAAERLFGDDDTGKHPVILPPSGVVLREVHWKTLQRLMSALISAGAVKVPRQGIVLNQCKNFPALEAEAARWVRSGAIVSMLTVLGEAGVLNNKPVEIWAVVPGSATSRGGSGAVKTAIPNGMPFRFVEIARHVLEAPTREDTFDARALYPRATPEAAFVHWIYRACSAGGKGAFPIGMPKQHDIQYRLLDEDRLARIAKAIGVEDKIAEWLVDYDFSDEEKVAPGLNY